MGGAWAFVFLPMLLGLPFACVAMIVRLCEWSWQKPRGSMGSTGMLAAYGLVCAVNLLAVFLFALSAIWFRG
jgi:hypothetical protein